MSKSPFLHAISQSMRQKGYALSTEKTYIHWIKRFIIFHENRHPETIAAPIPKTFLGCTLTLLDA